MTGKIFLKLILGIVCLLLVALITLDYTTTRVASESHIRTLVDQLAGKCGMIALSLPQPPTLSVEQAKKISLAAGGRLTIVRSDGKVLVDSDADASKMENHSGRPELIRAFHGGTGWSERQSPTIGIRFLYVAVPIQGGAIRLAMPISEVDQEVNRVRARILLSTALAFLPAIVIAEIGRAHV